MTAADNITIQVIFPIGQQLYDAMNEQARSTGASLDELYGDMCAGHFAQLPGLQSGAAGGLRSFHLEELGNRANMGGLMQATLVLSADLHALVQAIARDQKKPVEAICERLCVGALQMKTGVSA